jgi:hypothetical protein
LYVSLDTRGLYLSRPASPLDSRPVCDERSCLLRLLNIPQKEGFSIAYLCGCRDAQNRALGKYVLGTIVLDYLGIRGQHICQVHSFNGLPSMRTSCPSCSASRISWRAKILLPLPGGPETSTAQEEGNDARPKTGIETGKGLISCESKADADVVLRSWPFPSLFTV